MCYKFLFYEMSIVKRNKKVYFSSSLFGSFFFNISQKFYFIYILIYNLDERKCNLDNQLQSCNDDGLTINIIVINYDI